MTIQQLEQSLGPREIYFWLAYDRIRGLPRPQKFHAEHLAKLHNLWCENKLSPADFMPNDAAETDDFETFCRLSGIEVIDAT